MAEALEEAITFDVGDDRCEGIFAYPDSGQPHTALLILAPHPHFGGNMNNNVVRHVARAAAADGAATLRFNYRGLGASTLRHRAEPSVYDYYHRVEETRAYDTFLPECAAAWDTLVGACPRAAHRATFGYSLGALLAAKLAAARVVDHLISLSPPNRRTGLMDIATCATPTAFLGGDNDFAFDREALLAALPQIPAPCTFMALSGADHFFRGQEEVVYEMLRTIRAGVAGQ